MRTLNLEKSIKLFPEEEVLDVQRQHIVALLIPIIVVGIATLFAVFLAGTFSYLKYFYTPFYFGNSEYILLSMLVSCALSILFALSTYIFMHWYYQFYIFTNKRLIHVHFFRIGGFHLDEVLHERTDPLEIDREPQNVFYDFLGIEDVYVYFHRLERPEPFIFKTPENSARIEELLEGHLLKIREKAKEAR